VQHLSDWLRFNKKKCKLNFQINKNFVRVNFKDLEYDFKYDMITKEFASMSKKLKNETENIIDHHLIMREISKMMKDAKDYVNI
jgi:mevalonate kinase